MLELLASFSSLPRLLIFLWHNTSGRSTRLEMTLGIFASPSELGPADMVTLSRPTTRAGGVLALTQEQKKPSLLHGILSWAFLH